VFLDEIWHERQVQYGFDAVVSVPKNITGGKNNSVLSVYVKKHFPLVTGMQNASWTLFAQSLRLLVPNGTLAMVIDQKAFVTRADPLDQVLTRLLNT